MCSYLERVLNVNPHELKASAENNQPDGERDVFIFRRVLNVNPHELKASAEAINQMEREMCSYSERVLERQPIGLEGLQ
jgi:hypothetical protein